MALKKDLYVGESSGQKIGGRYQQWYQSRWLDHRGEGSWIKRKLESIRLKKLQNINEKFKQLKFQNHEPETREMFAKKMKKARCYNCKKRGHVYWNCPSKYRCKGKGKGKYETGCEQQQYERKFQESMNYMVKGTEYGSWNDIWYVSDTYSKHMSPNMDIFVQFKTRFEVETGKRNTDFLFSNGIGEIDLKTEKKTYVIPAVAYVPKIGINLPSIHQLTCQGFEVDINGSICTEKRMFEAKYVDPTNEDLLENQDNFSYDYFQDLDDHTPSKNDVECITKISDKPIENELRINAKKEVKDVDGLHVTENSFEGFIRFMNLANNKRAWQNTDLFKSVLENMIKWFHENYFGGEIAKGIPPKIIGLEICLFDLYELIKGTGGFERVTCKNKWAEIAMGFGFPETYESKFKEIYEDYLLVPEMYYEVAKEGVIWPQNYTMEGLEKVTMVTNKEDPTRGMAAPRSVVDQETKLGCNAATVQGTRGKIDQMEKMDETKGKASNEDLNDGNKEEPEEDTSSNEDGDTRGSTTNYGDDYVIIG